MKKMLFAVMAILVMVSCAGSVDVNTTNHEELVTIYNDAASKFKNAQSAVDAPNREDVEQEVEYVKNRHSFKETKALLTSPNASEEEKKIVAELEAKVKAAEEAYYAARNEFDTRMDAKIKEDLKDLPSIF